MSDLKRAADICDELVDLFRTVGSRGVTMDDIPVLVAAAEKAGREILAMVPLKRG